MKYRLTKARLRLNRLGSVRRTAFTAMLFAALFALGACDPRGSASVEQLIQRAQDQRSAGSIRAGVIELKNALQKQPQNATARLLLGQSFIDLGDVASAEIELKRAQELGADANRVSLLLAEARMLQNRFDQVLRDFPVAEAAPADAKAAMLELRGRAHLGLGQRVLAEEAFKSALSHNDKSVEALIGLARVAAASGNAAAARDYVARADAITPSNVKLLALKGDLAFANKDFEGAENFYKEVLKVRKDDLTALNAQLGVGRAQIAAGKLKDASTRLTQVLKLAPKHAEANFLRALAAYQSKEYEVAKTHAEAALAAAPNHRQSMFIAGASNYALQQNETALRHLSNFVNAVPDSAEGRKLLAALQMRMGEPARASRTLQAAKTQDAQMLAMAGAAAAQSGNPSAAKGALERAVAAEPQNAQARSQLGMTRISLGETEEGLKDLEAASKLNPGSEADITLALAYFRTKEFDKTIEAAKRVQERQPNRAIGHTLEGIAHRAKLSNPDAVKAFKKALDAEPGDRTALENLALVAIAENKPDEARGYYQELVNRNPTDARAQLATAQFDLQTGRQQEALSRLQSLVASQPDFVAGYVALARAQLLAGNAPQALATVNSAAQRFSENPDLLLTRGQAHMRLGQTAEAIAAYRGAIAQAPQAPSIPVAHQLLAAAYRATGDRPRALTEIDRALAIMPADPVLRLTRAQLLAETNKVDEAAKVVAELRSSYPNSAQIAELEGALALAQGRPADAITAYQRAVAQNASTESVVGLANAQKVAQQHDQAEATLRDWLAKHSDDVRARVVLADAYLTRRKLPEAEKEYTQILRLAPDTVIVLNNLAWTMAQQGRAQDALVHARKAAQLAPENPAVLDTLGTTLVRAGQAGEAIAPLRKAVEKAPGVRPLEFHLAEALAKQGQRDEAKTLLGKALAGNEPFEERAEAEKLLRELGG
jgi:putative PEP-CTERM system TPR-repeat lipoprotein